MFFSANTPQILDFVQVPYLSNPKKNWPARKHNNHIIYFLVFISQKWHDMIQKNSWLKKKENNF